jgi:hypothetical protein
MIQNLVSQSNIQTIIYKQTLFDVFVQRLLQPTQPDKAKNTTDSDQFPTSAVWI